MSAAISFRRGALALVALIVLALPARAAVKIEEVKTAQGITAWLIEDHTVPVVSMSAAFRGGAALDPADKRGLANFTVDLLDEGAGDLDSTAYQSKIEDLAAQLSFNASQDMISVRLRSLSTNLAPSFDMLRLALTQPRFDPEPVARVRADVLDSIANEKRQPASLASRLWWKTAFPDHPYGLSSRGTVESINAITPDDLHGFVRSRFGKDNLIVAVVGDVTPAQLKPLLDSTFGALPDHATPDTVPEATAATKGEVKVVNMPIPQSVVVFGQPGIKRNDPDWYAALLDLNILSAGGLTSRVALEVREQRGLAYSVSASLDPLQHAGVILGQVGSQNAHVAEFDRRHSQHLEADARRWPDREGIGRRQNLCHRLVSVGARFDRAHRRDPDFDPTRPSRHRLSRQARRAHQQGDARRRQARRHAAAVARQPAFLGGRPAAEP